MSAPDLFGMPPIAGAEFSPCGLYRTRLWRRWGSGRLLGFIMLNPSSADQDTNDPTVERCCRRARLLGYDGIQVANLFALISTDPCVLWRYGAEHIIGPANDAAILIAAANCEILIAAWGVHGRTHGRDQHVMRLLRDAGRDLHVLGLTKDGHPKHPLYVPYSAQPQPWAMAA